MQVFKKLLWVVLTIIFILKMTSIFLNEDYKATIKSDGRGYYAYLPAFILYGDPTFKKSHDVEQKLNPQSGDYWYLNKTVDNQFYNKYFPGIALLQIPFFLIAVFLSYIFGFPIDGYSPTFLISFLVGSLVYGFLGILFFKQFIAKWFGKSYDWFPLLIVLGTSLLFYLVNSSSFSHLYSFFLFGIFANLILRIQATNRTKDYLFFGLTVGLIFLVRPTNLLILLLIPFILKDLSELKLIIKNSFQIRKVTAMMIGFFSFIFLLMFIWKAQTGSFILWSYSGETFDFLQPKILQHLFSFRIGLFTHVPLFILAVIGLIRQKNRYVTLTWLLYTLPLIYIYSSWWCWDYASGFGPRVYSEHLFFLCLPIIYLLKEPKKLTYIFMILCLIISMIRFYEYESEILLDQRFTKENYVPSLAFWKKENKGRWNNTRYCHPSGKLENVYYLTYLDELLNVKPTDEFFNTVQQTLKRPRTNERYFIRVELDRFTTEKDFSDVFVVIDAFTKQEDKRFYNAIPLYNDKLKKNAWEHMIIEADLMDVLQEYDEIKVYIWNKGQKAFDIKNIRIIVEEYKV
jgi:hypothetical protein